MVRGRRVDEGDSGDLARVLLGVDEGVGAADGVSGDDVGPRDVRGGQKRVCVGGVGAENSGQPVAVSSAR